MSTSCITRGSMMMHRCCFNVVRGFSSSQIKRRSLLQSQYDRIKSQFPNHVVLFQVGDFYEIMGSDAETVSRKTSLRVAKRSSTSMVGFPVKALNEWQKSLVQAGFQLAVCNQMERKDTNGRLMDREVVHLVTPGTLTDPLDNEANYIMSIAVGPRMMSYGLAWLDISTSHFEVASTIEHTAGDNLLQMAHCDVSEHIERVNPVEIIISDDNHLFDKAAPMKSSAPNSIPDSCLITPVDRLWFDSPPKDSNVLKNFNTENYSLLEKSAVFALFNYILHTNCKAASLIQAPPMTYAQGSHMSIDANTRRALEITVPQYGNSKKTTLFGCIDLTVTAPGGRMLKRMLSRLETVEYFHNQPTLLDEIRTKLRSGAGDMERTLQKIIGGSASLHDLVSLLTTLECVQGLIDLFGHYDKVMPPLLDGMNENSSVIAELKKAIEINIDGTSSIRKDYYQDINRVNSKLISNEDLIDKLNTKVIDQTGVGKLSVVGHKAYYKVFETTRSKSAVIDKCTEPHGLIRIDHTQSNVRYTHIELQRLNIIHQQLEASYVDAVNNAFRQLCDIVASQSDELFKTAQSLVSLDVFTALAQLAIDRGFCKPTINKSVDFHINKGFHSVVSYVQLTSFVVNDCHMDKHKLWIITGPNMGGKSTFLRQNALITVLAQIGSFVPAEAATIGVVDKLFARVGASDNVANHQSTFHVEMSEMAHILCNATPNSFVILDEIGRGTSPTEGKAIAQSVAEYLHNEIGCRTLLATHFHDLSVLSDTHHRTGCYHVSAVMDNGSLTFDFRVKSGHTNSSFGIEVASLVGLPPSVIKRSLELLNQQPTAPQILENNNHSINNYVHKIFKKFIK